MKDYVAVGFSVICGLMVGVWACGLLFCWLPLVGEYEWWHFPWFITSMMLSGVTGGAAGVAIHKIIKNGFKGIFGYE